MNREETISTLALIKASYPLWAKDLKEADARNMIMVWEEMLSEYDFDLVKSAVKTMIKVSKWPPSINEVIEKCDFISSGCVPQMTRVEAWSYVRSALTNSTYNAKEEFDKLPKIIQGILRTQQTLKNWAMANYETIDSIEGSQFMRSFDQALVNEKNYNALPETLKNEVKSLTDTLAQKMLMDKPNG